MSSLRRILKNHTNFQINFGNGTILEQVNKVVFDPLSAAKVTQTCHHLERKL